MLCADSAMRKKTKLLLLACVCVFVQGTYGGETYECFENVVEEHQWRNLEQG